jgi:hypothetical protein
MSILHPGSIDHVVKQPVVENALQVETLLVARMMDAECHASLSQVFHWSLLLLIVYQQ